MNGQLRGGASGLPGIHRAGQAIEPDQHLALMLGSYARWFRGLRAGGLYLWPNIGIGPVTFAPNPYDGVVYGETTGGAVTVNLPAINGPGDLDNPVGRILAAFRLSAGANPMTINAAAGETINGAASLVLAAQYASVVLQATYFSGVRLWTILSNS